MTKHEAKAPVCRCVYMILGCASITWLHARFTWEKNHIIATNLPSTVDVNLIYISVCHTYISFELCKQTSEQILSSSGLITV